MVTATLQPTDQVEIHNLTRSHYLLPGGRTIRPDGVLKGFFLSQVPIEVQMDAREPNPRLAIVPLGAGRPTDVEPRVDPEALLVKEVVPSLAAAKAKTAPVTADITIESLPQTEDAESPLNKAAMSERHTRRRSTEREEGGIKPFDRKASEETLEVSIGGLPAENLSESVYDRDPSPAAAEMATWLRRGNDVPDPEKKAEQADQPRRGRRRGRAKA
jgi:hypothetical protein